MRERVTQRAPDRADAERRSTTSTQLAAAAEATSTAQRRSALAEVVLSNMPVARTIAGKYGGKGIPQDDLEQVAYAALVGAARRFRPEEGVDFLAFATPTIRGELKRHFRDHGWMIRPPRRVQEIQVRVLERRDELARVLDRPPTTEQVASDLREKARDVADALKARGCYAPTSLDAPVAHETTTSRLELLQVPDSDDLESADARLVLGPAVRRLSSRDRDIIKMRFFDGLTQGEIGTRLGVTQTQVSRILARILGQLHDSISGDLPAAGPSPTARAG